MCDRIATCATLAISYQHFSTNVVGVDEEHFGASRSNYDDIVDDVDRVQNSDIVWPCQIYRGGIRYSQGVTTCAMKSKWTRRRNRYRNAERPLDLRARITSVLETIKDYQHITIDFAGGVQEHIGVSTNDRDDAYVNNAPHKVQNHEDAKMMKDRMLGAGCPSTSALKDVQDLKDDNANDVDRVRDSDVASCCRNRPQDMTIRATKSSCFYEFLRTKRSHDRVDECFPDLGTHIDRMMESIDDDHPFEQGASDVVECLPCEDQTGNERDR
jgi:hypothetical protein